MDMATVALVMGIVGLILALLYFIANQWFWGIFWVVLGVWNLHTHFTLTDIEARCAALNGKAISIYCVDPKGIIDLKGQGK